MKDRESQKIKGSPTFKKRLSIPGGFSQLLLFFFLLLSSSVQANIESTAPQCVPEEKLVEADTIRVTRNKGLALTSDGERLFVLREVLSSTDLRGELTVVDLTTNQEVATVRFDVGRIMRVATSNDPDGSTRCYVTVSERAGSSITGGPNRVEVVKLAGDQLVVEDPILLPYPQGIGPVGIASNEGGTRLYAADRGPRLVHIIDIDPASPNRFDILGSVSTQGDPIGVAVTPDGSKVYAANRSQSTVACIDTATNQLVATIPVSVGPAIATTDITVSPDGTRAYAVYSPGAPCVSVIDTDPASSTFNEEIAVIPTTGDRLEAIAINSDGSRLFVVSRDSNRLLVIDTSREEQVQQLTMGSSPVDVIVRDSLETTVYVANSLNHNVSIISRGEGAFLAPHTTDGRTKDAFDDGMTPTGDCQLTSRNGVPDLGTDHHLVVTRENNIIRSFRADHPEWAMDLVLSNLHPVTGRYQTVAFDTPEAFLQNMLGLKGEPMSFFDRARALLLKTLEKAVPRRNEVTVDAYDAHLRPASFMVESQFEDSVMESQITAKDEDGDGITEGLDMETLFILPPMGINPTSFDVCGNGRADYVGFPYKLDGLQAFLPLGDTNGDGIPDSVALDFDHDGKPDPDLPLLPFLAGPANPTTEHHLYFAQFGDGGDESAFLFSQITLMNMDPNTAAEVKIILRKDDGSPLGVDLNSEVVNGEKELTIPAGGVVVLKTDGTGPLTVGSATVHSDRAVAGVILFGGNVGVAGVGVSHPQNKGFIANIENNTSKQISTGVALMNLEDKEVTYNLSLCNLQGKSLSTAQLPLDALGHRALFVFQIDWNPAIDLSNFKGLLKVTSSSPVAGTALQTRPGEYATLPVAPNFGAANGSSAARLQASRAEVQNDDSLNQKLYFPQFANGGIGGTSIFSQAILFNLTNQGANTKLILKKAAGTPFTVRLNGETVVGEKELVIPAGGLAVLESDGEGELTEGSLRVRSDQALAGVVLFVGSAQAGTAGVGSSSRLLRGFWAPMENNAENSISTGLAVMNLEEESVDLDLTLCDADGSQLATGDLSVPAIGQETFFLGEVNWQPSQGVTLDFSDFVGLMKVSASGKTAAAVVQTRPGVFATLPVVPPLN